MSPEQNRIIGRAVERYAQLGSTNDMLRQRAREGAAEGLVILADEQVAGRGRLGRAWQAPPGSSVLLSVLLRPTWLPADAAFCITMLAGVALCEAVEAVVPNLSAALKWPNDLLLPSGAHAEAPRRKVAGILSELVLDSGMVSYIVLGIGINVNWSPSGVVDGRDLSTYATSVKAAAGHEIDREQLLAALLERLDVRYGMLRRGRREAIFTAWRSRLTTLGHDVSIATPSATIHGRAVDVDMSGALILRDTTGNTHVITAGDVQA